MSDIHQEWNELRQKNGDFINHLDGEMAKLKQDKQLQDLLDAGAFAMQFVTPPQFNCCQDDRDILKALNKAQADRIKYLEDEFLACKEQRQVDLAVKKDLDEKLDKATADYRALWVENDRLKSQLANEKACNEALGKNAAKSYAKLETERNNLAETISRMEKTIRDLDERGQIKGMEELWDELKCTYANRTLGVNEKIFGYGTVGEIIDNLSPTWFMNKAREYHEQKEKEEARDIKLGDEVKICDQCDHSLSDIGIVIAMDKDDPCFAVIGPKFEACFTATDIDAGHVKKTGRHFDTIPLDYLA